MKEQEVREAKLTSTVSHVLDGGPRAVSDLERAILANLRSLKVRLEQGAHLSISGPGLCQDGEVNCEAQHVDQERENDEADDSGNNVGAEFELTAIRHAQITLATQTYGWHLKVAKLVPEILRSVYADHEGDEKPDELDA